ncbi:universal stress protein [Aequorivita sp. SDUM287046]|uniref:Universal stress protein n=1 Tax=Aequorivita aurantiaca TaxID=3053356 RepID=A0ABT8DFQ1_9FLAO|nr:universal stress protein [Aequorivita aurantiaca]MDN3724187.1 universal stress protein [Aequorivita aurantiaca]
MMNILIPTDFSDSSHNAMKYALEYFSGVEVNFHMLHVSSENFAETKEQESIIQSDEKIQTVKSVSALLKEEIRMCKFHTTNKAHNFFPHHENLSLVEAIRKKMAKIEIDFIVMGTRGNSTMESSELGSNACDVITKVKCPILVIPQNARFKLINNIAFLTDYNGIYRNKVISTLAQTLELHQSPLRVLHIKLPNANLTASQTDNKGFLHYSFKEKKHSFHFVESKDLEMGIQDFVETWDINLLSVVAKNLNFIQRLLLRPTFPDIGYTTKVPFLVLHE